MGKRVAALAGHSKAGSGVLCYASKYHDVPKVLNICGRFDGKTGAFILARSLYRRRLAWTTSCAAWHQRYIVKLADHMLCSFGTFLPSGWR